MAGDKYTQFKANVATQNEYREAYAALAARDPAAALKMPHPDSSDFDHAEALDAIRKMGDGMRADPRVDIKA